MTSFGRKVSVLVLHKTLVVLAESSLCKYLLLNAFFSFYLRACNKKKNKRGERNSVAPVYRVDIICLSQISVNIILVSTSA